MKDRVITLLNAIGCLVLTALVAFQWLKERASQGSIHVLKTKLVESQMHVAEGAKKITALESDILALKDAMKSTQEAAETASKDNAANFTHATQLLKDLSAARAQAKLWETSIAERDAILKQLNSELISTRRRLDEAIAKLKTAGAR